MMASLSKNKHLDPTIQRDVLNAQINKQAYDAQKEVPTKGDVNADTFTNMANSFQGAEAKGWGGAAKSFMIGMAGGARHASILDRKKDLDKYQKVMDYLGAVNQEAGNRNAEFEKVNQAKLSIQPKVAGFLQDLPNMTEPEIELSQRKLLDDYNALSGTNFKSAGYVGGSPQVALIVNDQNQTERVDIPSFFEMPGFEENMKLAMPNIRAEANQKQENTTINQNLKREQNELGRSNLSQRDTQFGTKHDPNAIYAEKTAESQAQTEQKELPKLEKSYRASQEIGRAQQRMKEIADQHPEMFDHQVLSKMIKADGEYSVKEQFAIFKLGEELASAFLEYEKLKNNLIYYKSKELGGQGTEHTMKVEAKGIPSPVTMTKGAFYNAINPMIEESKKYITDDAKKIQNIKASQVKPQGNSNQQSGSVKMISPDGKSFADIEPQDVNQALNERWAHA
jgi:hypothetical protein